MSNTSAQQSDGPDIVAGLWAPLCSAAFRVYSWFPGTLVFLHPTRLLPSTGNQLWLLCHATGALLHLPEQLFRGKKNLPLRSTVTVIQESLCFCQNSTKTLAVLWSVSLNNEIMVLPPCSSHIKAYSLLYSWRELPMNAKFVLTSILSSGTLQDYRNRRRTSHTWVSVCSLNYILWLCG